MAALAALLVTSVFAQVKRGSDFSGGADAAPRNGWPCGGNLPTSDARRSRHQPANVAQLKGVWRRAAEPRSGAAPR
jgi:hypothetical protein